MTAPGRRAPLVVAHLSDLHLGAHDPDAVESVVADVAAVRPALTVVTGDCTMRARVHQFRQARELLDRLPGPLLVVLGNHDVPLVSAARLVAPYRRYRRLVRSDLDPVVRLPGLTALGLHTAPAWRWKSGRVSRRQSDAVVAVLGAATPEAVRMLALHHPPRATGPARLAGRGRLFRALAAARVDLLLAGHTHLPAAALVRVPGTAHRLVEVVAGTAVSRRTRGVGRSWTVIRVDEQAVVVEERHQAASGWLSGHTQCWPRRP
ncbi:metallophosphoesterase family protein [Couchioplanes caeruleus]|uniref:Cyclic nucleotide-binding protein n=2 Tax=Couchioplanes caeruleus TaxID=56438 RepID=A0A1K0FA34_9ACTN|nr:metallophosphoesterase [Couchioplanes caeruleus]OJF09733.1 cyclic nucleotide-binding protein [Couchioplanes caeruleus subsp. caeruleus]ROP28736.1 3',5'-cyclic AMP phosphodiesterase CpdA [Couchioplanes caeruleus]